MAARLQMTSIYLVCYHSQKPDSFAGAERQFLTVERAISNDEWPYDNGDDPSFFVAKKGGPLTWGVCRQDVRNSIPIGSIVVFFAFTPLVGDRVMYRLCSVATVADKKDVRAIHDDGKFARFRGLYINSLIRPNVGGWLHDESDRSPSQRHKEWLWRIADHRGTNQKRFNKMYSRIYGDEWAPNSALTSDELKLAENYIVFSTRAAQGYISPTPPEVAIARKGA